MMKCLRGAFTRHGAKDGPGLVSALPADDDASNDSNAMNSIEKTFPLICCSLQQQLVLLHVVSRGRKAPSM